MRIFEWRKNSWYRRAIFVLTLILIVLLAAHPELRLLLPLVDTMGLDILLFLISAQLLDYVRPAFTFLFHSAVIPLTRRIFFLAIYLLGIMGPYVEARISSCRVSRIHVI